MIFQLFRRPNHALSLYLFNRGRHIVSLSLFCSTVALGQGAEIKGWGEAGTYVGNSQNPLWLRANQFGTVPVEKQIFSARTGFLYNSRAGQRDSASSQHSRGFRWGVGTELILNVGHKTTSTLLPEAFVKVAWKKLEFWAGRRKEIIGIVDTTLTTGSFTWSGNALPVPKIQIGLPEYLPLSFLKNYVSIKGFFAHGWYNTPYIQGSYLHQKSLLVRIGKPEGVFSFQAGASHHVTWAGHAEYMKDNPHIVNGKLAGSFQDYLRGVVLAKVSKEYRNNRYTNFDGENRIGNHVGQFDFALTYQTPKAVWMFYNNHPFEDASGVVFRNMPDGLYGLSWKRKKEPRSIFEVTGVLAEYFFSKDQSGAGWNVPGSRFKGNDNYFNHGQFIQGWSYFGRGMGSPLIATRNEITQAGTVIPEFFPSSRAVAYHAGLEGRVASQILWQARTTFSTHFGTNNILYPSALRQFSGLLSVEAPLLKKGTVKLITRIAYDQGDFLGTSLAGYIGVRLSGQSRK